MTPHIPEFDVIVIGAGGAGLVAAMAAAGEGARVLHCEKTSHIGGCWVPGIGNAGSLSGAQTLVQFDCGVFEDSPDRFYADCMRDLRAMSVCDAEILKFYCRHAGFAVDWLDRLGVFKKRDRKAAKGLFGEEWTVPRSYYMDHDFLEAVLAVYRQYVARDEIRLMLKTEVKSLLMDRGRVVGVVVETDGITRTIQSRAVVVCTGGFAADVDMVRRYNLPGTDIITTAAMPFATGDGLRMCREIGAGIVNTGATMVMGPFLSGVPDPERPGRELGMVNIACPGVLLVDLSGRRFINEDCGRLSLKLRKALLRRPDGATFAIFDHAALLGDGPVITGRSGEWVEEQAVKGRVVKRAETVWELARLLHLDESVLVNTVRSWNQQVDYGCDGEFGRSGPLRRLTTPPYYAVPLGLRVVASSGGPMTTTRQEVVGESGRVIPGVFAAGEVTGYQGYGTGMFNTGCVVFGKQAGRMAAREALGLRPKSLD